MEGDTILVPRAAFAIEEPWAVPRACVPVELRRSTDGNSPRLGTSVATYHDGDWLHFVFVGADDGIVATHLQHDAPLYQEDVFEVFLAPGAATAYFEIEVNPLATTFDARIDSPEGVRSSMKADLGWTCEGLFAAVRRTPESWECVLRFRFLSVAAAAPKTGDTWGANLFRIDRSGRHGDEYSAWRPTMKNPPDFHVVATFGGLRFG